MKLRETLERDPGYLCLSPRNATSQLGTLPSGNGRQLSIAAVRPVHEAVQGTRAPMPWGWLCHVPVPGALSSAGPARWASPLLGCPASPTAGCWAAPSCSAVLLREPHFSKEERRRQRDEDRHSGRWQVAGPRRRGRHRETEGRRPLVGSLAGQRLALCWCRIQHDGCHPAQRGSEGASPCPGLVQNGHPKACGIGTISTTPPPATSAGPQQGLAARFPSLTPHRVSPPLLRGVGVPQPTFGLTLFCCRRQPG